MIEKQSRKSDTSTEGHTKQINRRSDGQGAPVPEDGCCVHRESRIVSRTGSSQRPFCKLFEEGSQKEGVVGRVSL